MKKLSYILLSFLFSIFIISCDEGTAGDSSGTPSYNGETGNYKIIKGGGIMHYSNWTDKYIDTNYDTFFVLQGEKRLIYFGGINNYIYGSPHFEFDDQDLMYNDKNFMISKLYDDNNTRWYTEFNYTGTGNAGDYKAIARVGEMDELIFSEGANKEITIKMGEDGDRDWNISIWHQESYDEYDYDNVVDKNVKKAFTEGMNVNLIIDDHDYDLPNQSMDFQTYGTYYNAYEQFSQKPAVQWAYKYIKELSFIPDAEETEEYIIEDHESTEGDRRVYLFYVESGTGPTNDILGNTTMISSISHNQRWAICWVFAKTIRDKIYDGEEWKKKVIAANTIHELGHAWCEEFTNTGDYQSHITWHNGDNENLCLMHAGKFNEGYLDETEKKILKLSMFCEGHNQRGMNISWKRNRFLPYGEKEVPASKSMKQDIYSSISNNIQFSEKVEDISVILSLDTTEFFPGQFINYLVTIKNNSDNIIKIQRQAISSLLFYDQLNNNLLSNSVLAKGSGWEEYGKKYEVNPNSQIIFPGHKSYYLPVHPPFNKHFLEPGKYKTWVDIAYVNVELKKFIECKSNEIEFEIKPVPKSEEKAFNLLKDIIINKKYLKLGKNSKYSEIKELFSRKFIDSTIYKEELTWASAKYLFRRIKEEKALKDSLNNELLIINPEVHGFYRYFDAHNTNNQKEIEKLNEILEKSPRKKAEKLKKYLKTLNVEIPEIKGVER